MLAHHYLQFYIQEASVSNINNVIKKLWYAAIEKDKNEIQCNLSSTLNLARHSAIHSEAHLYLAIFPLVIITRAE